MGHITETNLNVFFNLCSADFHHGEHSWSRKKDKPEGNDVFSLGRRLKFYIGVKAVATCCLS